MNTLSRRNLIGAGLGSGILMTSSKTAFGSQANSAISLGIIGCGGRGSYVGGLMAKVPGVRLAAICDAFPDRTAAAQQAIPAAKEARVYSDLTQLLAQKDIDAVLIATPVFLHPEHFEAAVQARKHIYCEKPAGASVKGVKRMLAAAAKTDPAKTIQFGFQQRFSPEYLRGMEMYRTGVLGDVKLLMSYWVLGGVPMESFVSPYPEAEQKLRHWGAWTEYSGGVIVEQDCHGVDILNWFSGSDHPVSAGGSGGLRYRRAYGDHDSDHHDIAYVYPNNVEAWLISIKQTGNFRDVKEQVFGSKGMLELARTYYKLHGPKIASALSNADDLSDRSLIERRNSTREITIDAVEAFFASIAQAKPHNMAQVAADATYTSLLGRMAYQLKREVTWKELIQSA